MSRCWSMVALVLLAQAACDGATEPDWPAQLFVGETGVVLEVGDSTRVTVALAQYATLFERPRERAPNGWPEERGTPSWSSSRPDVAEVTRDGWVYAKSAGTATLTVRSGSIRDTATVHVVASGSQGGGLARIAAGGAHTCGLDDDGGAFCWGNNSSGELGIGAAREFTATVSPAPVGGGPFTKVSSAGSHSCALDPEGYAWCWGANEFGQLGNTTRIQRASPARVSGTMRFTSIATGPARTCALDPIGAVVCWGAIAPGQEMLVPVALDFDARFVHLSVDTEHACGLTSLGEAYCWGSNTFGQLGDGTFDASATPVRAGGAQTFSALDVGASHTCAIDLEDVAFCWGRNSVGELGIGYYGGVSANPQQVAGDRQWSTVSAGSVHTCGVTTDHRVYCWGHNIRGQVGVLTEAVPGMSFEDWSIPAPMLVSDDIELVSAGLGHTCALSITAEAYCWGENTNGQLGYGRQDFPESHILSFSFGPGLVAFRRPQ